MLQTLNTTIAFLLELVMLVAFGYWGFHGDRSTALKWILGLGIPLAAAVLWSMFLAPRSAYRLTSTAGNLLALILFLLAAAALYTTGHPVLAILLAVVAIVNRLLILAWKQW